MVGVDTAPEEMHVRVTPRLRLVEPSPAREHDVGARHQELLTLRQIRRRESELCQFVHAVVHDAAFVERADHDRRRHRRVKPLHWTIEHPGERAASVHQLLQQ